MGIYQNFVVFASICAERLDENEVNRMREVVEALDNKDRVIRPQTFKERPLMYKEYVILARRLIEEYTFVKKNKQLNDMLDKIIHDRWVDWHIQQAAHPSNKGQFISEEAGISPEVERNFKTFFASQPKTQQQGRSLPNSHKGISPWPSTPRPGRRRGRMMTTSLPGSSLWEQSCGKTSSTPTSGQG